MPCFKGNYLGKINEEYTETQVVLSGITPFEFSLHCIKVSLQSGIYSKNSFVSTGQLLHESD